MKIARALVTAAHPEQRTLSLQRLVDSEGHDRSALQILIQEVVLAGIDELCIVIHPGDQPDYEKAAGDQASRLHFVEQSQPRGYGDALLRARSFVDGEPFLHLVNDHLHVSHTATGCARQLVEVATREQCSVAAVKATRETQLPYYGVVGGRPVARSQDLYLVEHVVEKPTPTQAEQELLVPGLRVGHYLCLFGMHVLTPGIWDILERQEQELPGNRDLGLSEALDELAAKEKFLAFAVHGERYNIGVRYGLLTAQLALCLHGKDRDQILTLMLELLANQARSQPEGPA